MHVLTKVNADGGHRKVRKKAKIVKFALDDAGVTLRTVRRQERAGEQAGTEEKILECGGSLEEEILQTADNLSWQLSFSA